MPIQMGQRVKQEGVFFYLLLLTGFFLLFEISFFIQCNKAYLGDFTYVADKLSIPLAILPGIAFFLFAQLILHLAYCVAIWILTTGIAELFSPTSKQRLLFGIAIWLLGVITLLLANQYYFPHSKFADLTAALLPNRMVLGVLLLGLSIINLMAILLALAGLAKLCMAIFSQKHYGSIGFILAIALLSIFVSRPAARLQDAATQAKPNIIIIGVDSLRPDFLGYFGGESTTPFMDAFLKQSTVFTEAITPLARTFPSWTAILTGEYPRLSGIRSNLASQTMLDKAHTLPAILQQNGYETLFATDEVRFSNIDESYGFDTIISPPMGLNDFLLGAFNDFPLSNFIVNTSLGRWLFPYSYANRPVFHTYRPESFINLLKSKLIAPRSKPLFLTAHFCLTHHPYLWDDSPVENTTALARYEQSVSRIDKQLNLFFKLLVDVKLLDHALIVLLSDHGEALALSGDRITDARHFLPTRQTHRAIPEFYPKMLEGEGVNQSAGHGTDVLGLTQYHTLLAFRAFGLGWQQRGDKSAVVSLVDIKPTILRLLKVALLQPHFSGISLYPLITTNQTRVSRRHLFLESDYTPEAIRTVYPDARHVLLEGVELFQIDPLSTRLTMKESMSKMIIASKQYADLYDEWLLALYPQKKNVRIPILVNLISSEWTDDLSSSFAKQSPANRMLIALKRFYGSELGVISYTVD